MPQRTWAPVLYLIAPASVGGWFGYFALLGPHDRVIEIGEGSDVDETAIRHGLNCAPAGGARQVVIFSGHDTLWRDIRLADALRAEGLAASAQSPACARIGYDKFAMKQFFDAHGFSHAKWGGADTVAAVGSARTPVVVKRRHGTQSVGTRLSTIEHCALRPDEFAEVFIDGVEYSVIVFRDEHGTATFPPVWKGSTSAELTPPWRRLRLCPDPSTDPALDHRLRDVATNVTAAADGYGHIEVEMLVDGTRDIHILEINPRVSGTMRISAMATRVPIFSMHRLPEARGRLAAVRNAAEVPYSGPAMYDPEGDVFATSRLTLAADDDAQLRAKLGAVRTDAPGSASIKPASHP